MAKRDARRLEQTGDGPPAIQRETIKRAGAVIREPTVERAEWKDPDDTGTRARHHGARPVRGWRRVWVIQRLHDTSPREITSAHVKAAERLLNDYQRGVDGVAQGGMTNDRVDGCGAGGFSDAQIDALQRYREAVIVLGSSSALIVTVMVVDNWSITKLADHLGIHRDRAFGRLQAGLERLREHYAPPRRNPAAASLHEALAPEHDADGAALPADRIGRWRPAQDRRREPLDETPQKSL